MLVVPFPPGISFPSGRKRFVQAELELDTEELIEILLTRGEAVTTSVEERIFICNIVEREAVSRSRARKLRTECKIT